MIFKLVALDIDGTLLDSDGQLPPGNIKVIRETVAQGIKVILVTGRRFSTAKRIAEMLQLNYPIVVHNGALIRLPFNNERLARCFLPAAAASRILSFSTAYFPYTVIHQDKPPDGQMVVHRSSRANASLRSYLEKVPQSVVEVECLLQVLDDDLIQIMFSGELSAVQEIDRCLSDSGATALTRLSRTYYPAKGVGILDVLNRECSKGRALEYLANYYGYAPEEILAIGDNHNDLEMLQYAGLGVVVANCVQELKSMGFTQTSSNDDLGVARTLMKYVLPS